MNYFLAIFLLTYINTSIWCQCIPAEIGDIQVEVSTFSFNRTKSYELTRKTTKYFFSKYFFDSQGNLIEEVHYGKQHNSNLKLLDRVEQHYYSPTGQLTKSNQWDTDYDKNIHHTYYTIYTYDNEDRLVKEVTYTDKDSVLIEFTIEYTDNKSITRLGNSQTTIKEFDRDKRLISEKQLWDSDTKTNWISRYSYKENCIIEDFVSYYDNPERDYSKKKTNCYENGRLVEAIEYYVDTDGLNEKKTLTYGQNGILEKIEVNQYSIMENKYELVGFIQFKTSAKERIAIEATKNINDQLIDLALK